MEKLAEKEQGEKELKEKLQRLTDMIVVSSQIKPPEESFKQRVCISNLAAYRKYPRISCTSSITANPSSSSNRN